MNNEKSAVIITDLGGGDGGKGAVLHKVCLMKDAHTVVKVGGAQGSHGVSTSRGQKFNFSQFGCGTLDGVRTHITCNMVMEPLGLLQEALSLKYEMGIVDVFDLLTVDEDAICITPFHAIASQLRELARKENQKGTIGIGAGETGLDAEAHPDLIIRAGDLKKPKIRERLEAVRAQKIMDLQEIVANVSDLWEDDLTLARELVEQLMSPAYVDNILEGYESVVAAIKIVDREYFEREVLRRDGSVVIENSNGILTDRYYGFHPFVSRLRTIPQTTVELLQRCGYDGKVIKLGVSRAYQIRHGAGPMVTQSPDMTESLLPGSSKDENRWQGKVRVGPLDFVALQYSIEACGGPQFFDGLSVTWADQIKVLGKWSICDRYEGANDQQYFTPEGKIRVRRGSDAEQSSHQQRLGILLQQCKPVVTTFDVSQMSQDELVDLISKTVKEKLNLRVRMVSVGPTENDKVCI